MRKEMKKIFMLVVLLSSILLAKTPWAKYVENPSDENAKEVFNVHSGDGYKLFYNNFEKSVKLYWGYN